MKVTEMPFYQDLEKQISIYELIRKDPSFSLDLRNGALQAIQGMLKMQLALLKVATGKID